MTVAGRAPRAAAAALLLGAVMSCGVLLGVAGAQASLPASALVYGPPLAGPAR